MSDPSSKSPTQPTAATTVLSTWKSLARVGVRRVGGLFTSALWEILTTWGPAFLVVLVIRSMFIEPFTIPSGSMVPTLAIGDNIVVTKFSVWVPYPAHPLSST